MKCDKCVCQIERCDETEYMGQILCEDCYMDTLSPVRTCDPWGVYNANSMIDGGSTLTKLQEDILVVLKETDGIELERLAKKLGLKLNDLHREIATLRHMGKIRATMKDGQKVFCLWS